MKSLFFIIGKSSGFGIGDNNNLLLILFIQKSIYQLQLKYYYYNYLNYLFALLNQMESYTSQKQ